MSTVLYSTVSKSVSILFVYEAGSQLDITRTRYSIAVLVEALFSCVYVFQACCFNSDQSSCPTKDIYEAIMSKLAANPIYTRTAHTLHFHLMSVSTPAYVYLYNSPLDALKEQHFKSNAEKEKCFFNTD